MDITSNGRGLVLVTGATGFTGGHLALALAARGLHVRALARVASDTRLLRDHGIHIVEGDLLDRDAVDRAVAGVRRVYHIAAVYRTSNHSNDYYFDVNVGGTERVLDAARKHGVERVIHCSTAGVHGGVATIPADESAPFAPGDVYQESKLQGELAAQRAFAGGLPGVVFRPVGMYGPRDTRFLKMFRGIQRRRFPIFGSGEVRYHMTYIDDLVDGIIRCGDSPAAIGQTYLLAGPRYTTLNELAALVAQAVGVPPPALHLPVGPLLAAGAICEWVCKPLGIEPPLHRRRADFFVKERAFCIDKAKRELGYAPRVDLSEGLARTAAWYFEKGYLTRK